MERTVKMRKTWQESYELFIAYKKEFPDVPISAKTKYHYFNLGKWVSHQREAYKNGTMTAERIYRLEEAGMIWDVPEETWEAFYKAFVAYQKENPNTPIPVRTEYHGFKLRSWIGNQRQAYKNGTLSAEKIQRLEEVGFIWYAYEEAWKQTYRAFVAYKKEFPDTDVPIKAEYHGLNLGKWVGTQRRAKKKGTLSAERIKLLEEAGIVWEIHKSTTEVIAMFERGENVYGNKNNFILPIRIRKHLWQKYNNSCAIGQVDLNNFTILPESFLILDGKICGFKGKKPNGNPNLDIAHLDDIYSNNTIENLLPLCPNCHGSITYGAKQTLEHLRKANITYPRRRGSKTMQSIPSD